MMVFSHEAWQLLTTEKQKKLIKTIFFQVIFTRNDCLEYMEKKDYYQLLRGSYVYYGGCRGKKTYAIVLDFEFFSYFQDWTPFCEKFETVVNWFRRHISEWTVGNLQLFNNDVYMENMVLWLKFNTPALFQWFATHDLKTFNFRMISSVERKWKQLPHGERDKLLRDLFFTALLTHVDCPAFMAEQDWENMYQDAGMYLITYHQQATFRVHIFLEPLADRYWTTGELDNTFFELVNWLRGLNTRIRIGQYYLFEHCKLDNMNLWFYFNMKAVFFWMSTQQLTY